MSPRRDDTPARRRQPARSSGGQDTGTGTSTDTSTETRAEEIAEPEASARAAGLRYVTDAMPGIQRRRSGRGFRYLDANGEAIHDPDVLERIKALAVPPAWTDVWICPTPRGHLQATGRDDRGRKQYRYHPRWRKVRDETKYDHLIDFADALPTIRERVAHDLASHGLPREKVLATVVQLLELTLIRVGNTEYARENGSYGLTTLRNKHVDIHGSALDFHFRGKSGKEHEVSVHDPRLARIVKRCRDIPGYELFQYLDEEGQRHSVESADVNDYLREITEQEFTAKDFRTWAGTLLAARSLRTLGPCETKRETKANIAEAVKTVADHLGNTPAISRKSYIHPYVLDAYEAGTLLDAWDECSKGARRTRHESKNGLHPDEATVLAILRRFATAD